MKIYLIAGEPSGDTLGARLMRAFADRYPDVEFYGVGGENMAHEGLHSLFDIADLSVMGFAEVVPSIPLVLRHIQETLADIQKVKPDAIVTIDSWSFSARVHQRLRRLKLGVPQIHYVAPQVWAWKKKRAKTMYKYIDLLLTLFPYEPKYFTPYHLKAVFVGHPVIESRETWGNGADFRARYNIEENQKILAVLPGSRKTEVCRLLPVFLKTVQSLRQKYPDFCFVLPTVHTVEKSVRQMVEESGLDIRIITNSDDRRGAFLASDVAIAASGTVALELAIADVPHIVAYKVSPLTAWLVKHFLKIQFVNLTNILLGREVVPELLQEACNEGNILYHVEQLLKKDALYERQMEGFAKLRELMSMGEQTPSANACEAIVQLIEKK